MNSPLILYLDWCVQACLALFKDWLRELWVADHDILHGGTRLSDQEMQRTPSSLHIEQGSRCQSVNARVPSISGIFRREC